MTDLEVCLNLLQPLSLLRRQLPLHRGAEGCNSPAAAEYRGAEGQ